MEKTTRYVIDGWLVEGDANRLSREGVVQKVEPKVMQVLLFLIAHQGETVSKDALMEEVWGEVIVTEHSVNKTISKLRKVFGEDPHRPRIIETISKKGYQLIAPVQAVNRQTPAQHPVLHPQPVEMGSAIRPTRLTPATLGVALAGLALVLLALWSSSSQPQHTGYISSASIMPLTASVGMEMRVSFAPDEQDFIYTHKDPETLIWDLYLQKDQEAIQLTDTPSFESFPRYAPGGKTIAFVRFWEEGAGLFTMALDERRLETLLVEEPYGIIGFDWSPDGKQIVYAARGGPNRANKLILLMLETQERIQLTAPDSTHLGDRFPAFSPDGQSVLFARIGPELSDDLYMISTDGSNLEQLTHHRAFMVGMDWSEATGDIYYCVQEEERYLLKRITQDRKTETLLTTMSSKLAGAFPTVTPSGEKLAFEQWHLRRNIYSVSLDPTRDSLSAPESFITSTYSDWNAQFSPDGEHVVFVTDRSGKPELWMGDREGRHLEKIAQVPSLVRLHPRWSPDGRSIVFAAKGDVFDTYVLDVATKEVRLFEPHASDPAFSRDGKWIYFSTSRHGNGYQQIWKKPVSGGEAVLVPATGGTASLESTDGRTLFFTKVNQPGLWQLDEQGSETLVLPELRPTDDRNWIVVDEGIYYIKRPHNNDPVLVYYDLHTQEERLYREVDLNDTYEEIHGLSLAPNGTDLLFAKLDHADSDLMYVELN